MQSLREMLTEAKKDSSQKTWSDTKWDRILMDFCGWLNEEHKGFLGASLNEAWGDYGAPRVRTLRLWPWGQRNVQRTVLAVQTSGETAVVLGGDPCEIREEADFNNWLVDFFRNPRFRDTLETMKDLASQPVEGELRVGADRKMRSLSDVTVEVPPDQQRRLADASEAKIVGRIDQIYVMPATGRVWGATYSEETKPTWLIAGGYALKIDPRSDAPESDGRIRLSGEPVPLSELD